MCLENTYIDGVCGAVCKSFENQASMKLQPPEPRTPFAHDSLNPFCQAEKYAQSLLDIRDHFRVAIQNAEESGIRNSDPLEIAMFAYNKNVSNE